MIPWELLDRAEVPGSGKTLTLHRHDRDYSIRVGNLELMNSRMHGSEEALAELGCRPISSRPAARILIGGLGMGFTLAKALAVLGPAARIDVAELVPAVAEWNRGVLAHLAGRPLDDPRAAVVIGDAAGILRSAQETYDAILLDIDNGPAAFTHQENAWFYMPDGLRATYNALKFGGVYAVWSAGPSVSFTKRLQQTGFSATEHRVPARAEGGGSRHTIWTAIRQPRRCGGQPRRNR